MLQVGRNAPCPCGSGKKFKKCCLGKGDDPAPASLSGGERESALARLREFASGPEFAESRRAAEAVFRGQCAVCGEDHAHTPEAGRANTGELPEAFETWFALDVNLRNRRTPVSLLLERYGSRLPRGERGYLERMRDTCLRLYQVIDLGSDGRPRLLDLWTGETLWLREAPSGPRLDRWDVLAARIVEDAGGVLAVDSVPYRFPVRARDALLRALRRAHVQMGRPSSVPDMIRFFKNSVMTFHHVWLTAVAHDTAAAAGGALVRPLVYDRTFFDVRDRVRLLRAIARHSDFEPVGDDGTWVWMENPLLHDRTLGRLALQPQDRLVLETWVDGAQEHGRTLLGHLAGAALRFLRTEHLGVQLPLREGAP